MVEDGVFFACLLDGLFQFFYSVVVGGHHEASVEILLGLATVAQLKVALCENEVRGKMKGEEFGGLAGVVEEGGIGVAGHAFASQ